MEIIVPAAGLSTRFPGSPPKYLLRDATGSSMLKRALTQYLGQYPITVGILAQHDHEHNARQKLTQEMGPDINIVVLPELTRGPAHTVFNILTQAAVNSSHAFMVRDCDSFFTSPIPETNFVCVNRVSEHGPNYQIANKSFVVANSHDIIQQIVEKTVVSDCYCVGGYGFVRVQDYLDAFCAIQESPGELFVSHVISYMLNNGRKFFITPVSEYVDVGTLPDWLDHNNRTKFTGH